MIAPMGDAETVLERCDLLARCSEEPDRLTRRFATPALREARDLVRGWMRDAGLATRCDPIGNLVGRLDGGGNRALVLGSHLDTVPDAGRYDGPLGVLIGMACAERLHEHGRRLPFALEVVGFADEEGARYRTAFLGSAVMAGRFEAAWLGRVDADGTRVRLGDTDARILVEDGVRYRVDPGGARIRIERRRDAQRDRCEVLTVPQGKLV